MIYTVKNNKIEEYVEVGDILIPSYFLKHCLNKNEIINKDNVKVFTDKDEAYFQNTLERLESGSTTIKKLKKSPYYKMYIKKLQKHAPEYLI